jgi:hypothetical protein
MPPAPDGDSPILFILFILSKNVFTSFAFV